MWVNGSQWAIDVRQLDDVPGGRVGQHLEIVQQQSDDEHL